MKLLFYINTISHGGAERVMVNLATDLAERGHDCRLVTSFRTPKFEYAVGEKVKRVALTERRVGNPLFRNIKYISLLRKEIKQFEPNVVISFMPQPNFRSLIATRGLKARNIISVRNDPNREYRSRLNKIFAKALYKKTDGIVFQTEEARDWFPEVVRTKGTIIFNQVDERFYNTPLSDEGSDIVAVGKLRPQKDHRMLIDAYADVCGTVEDRLLIYGEGELRDKLQKQIDAYHLADRVKLMGVTTDVPNTIKTAKVYVLSSDYEGMPNALMEAMAMGLPCISTDCPCGGPKTLFGEELKDYLVPVNDDQTMGRKIKELLEDDEKREKVGRLCMKKAEEFRPHVIIEKWENYIKEVATR